MSISVSSPGTKAPTGIGTRLFVSVFFLFFLGMGCLFVGLIAREAVAGLRTWTWTRADCEITRSGVRETDQRGRRTADYYLDVQYRYSLNGRSFSSERRTLKPAGFSDYGKVERLAESYPVGAHTTCYVNPAMPQEAVLERGSLLFPLLVLFPFIFVGIGAIGIYSAWRPGSPSAGVARPISDRAGGPLGQRFAIGFFALFAVVGALVFYFISARPLARILSARQWPAVPCWVVSSEVKSQRDQHGSTYSVNILYRYAFNDREYKANQYDFMGGSSSGYGGKQSIVARYAPGSQQVCYVNPSQPTEAVLVRGFTPMMWIGLLPLLFLLLGLTGMISTARRFRSRTFAGGAAEPLLATTKQAGSAFASEVPTRGAPLTLRPKSSPTGKLVGMLLLALFWNGIISVFLVNLLRHWRAGYFEWFLALFLCPFVLIGLGFVAAVFYFLLGMFNPRPHLTITPAAAGLGETLRVEWNVVGRVEVLRSMRVRLEGREEATYSRGTRSTTDRNVFADLEIASLTQSQDMRSGSGNVTIPAGSMHSFSSQHNKIVWNIRLHGDIQRWPDLDEEFPVTVLPSEN